MNLNNKEIYPAMNFRILEVPITVLQYSLCKYLVRFADITQIISVIETLLNIPNTIAAER